VNKMDRPNSQNLDQLNSILDEMKKIGKLEGIIFAYRDGGLIYQNISKDIDEMKFTSMCASVLESAEELGRTIDDKQIKRIITEIEKNSILIFKCDEKTFLTIIVNDESKIGLILDQLDTYIQRILEKFY
jgi:predicted regulator of Ras-like GTPase activity (Roadblock/LC7/MglB family)